MVESGRENVRRELGMVVMDDAECMRYGLAYMRLMEANARLVLGRQFEVASKVAARARTISVMCRLYWELWNDRVKWEQVKVKEGK